MSRLLRIDSRFILNVVLFLLFIQGVSSVRFGLYTDSLCQNEIAEANVFLHTCSSLLNYSITLDNCNSHVSLVNAYALDALCLGIPTLNFYITSFCSPIGSMEYVRILNTTPCINT